MSRAQRTQISERWDWFSPRICYEAKS